MTRSMNRHRGPLVMGLVVMAALLGVVGWIFSMWRLAPLSLRRTFSTLRGGERTRYGPLP